MNELLQKKCAEIYTNFELLGAGTMTLTIYAVWHSGRANAPANIQKIFDLWQRFNPSADFRIYSEKDVNDCLDGLGVNPRGMTIQVRTDIFRVYNLSLTGGAWVDATLLPTRPMKEWLFTHASGAPFFAFRRPARDRIISNWFLYAQPHSKLIQEWHRQAMRYWSIRRSRKIPWHLRRRFRRDTLWTVRSDGGARKPYFPHFWHHYLFEGMIRDNLDLLQEWQAVPSYSALIPHVMQRCREAATTDEFISHIPEILPLSPVHKLNWRKEWPAELFDQALALAHQARQP